MQGRLYGRRWYGYMDVIGRVESGTETENTVWNNCRAIGSEELDGSNYFISLIYIERNQSTDIQGCINAAITWSKRAV